MCARTLSLYALCFFLADWEGRWALCVLCCIMIELIVDGEGARGHVTDASLLALALRLRHSFTHLSLHDAESSTKIRY